MLFNSIEFIYFFIVVTFLYFTLPQKYRWMLLLGASCFFYMAFIPVYIFILFFLIIIDYSMGILIEKSEGKLRKVYLLISIIATCCVLFVFKYFNFFSGNVNHIAQLIDWNYSIESLSLILPIGLSFHTFQSLSYVIEVYRKNQKAEKNLGIYAVYVMFYPQLVAGPIERPQNLLHQFYEKHEVDFKRIALGLQRMIWGLFKKVVIADYLAIFVNYIYNSPSEFTGLPLIIATIFFAFQIYCDFSGYSDIALGSAQVMGFTLMENFKRPYFAKSISEFWRRWHISLSTWFKDYVYIPLGGNRVSKSRNYFNLMTVFVVSGVWHGANWTFVIWGALHGFYSVFSLIIKNIKEFFSLNWKLDKFAWINDFFKILWVFIIVNIGWIFFRANSVQDAFYVLTHLFYNITLVLPTYKILMGWPKVFYGFALILALILIEVIDEKYGLREFWEKRSIILRWSWYIILIMVILLFGVFNKTQFIYFQF